MDVYAKRFFDYSSIEELRSILKTIPADEAVLHIGGGSNLLFTHDYEGVALYDLLADNGIAPEEVSEAEVRAADQYAATVTGEEICEQDRIYLAVTEDGEPVEGIDEGTPGIEMVVFGDSDSKNAKLLKTISALKTQIEEKDKAIATLTEELEQRNYDIGVLKENVAQLNTQVTNLEEDVKAKDETITAQTDLLNEAYVCIGNTKTLKEAGILKGGFLKKAKLNMSEVNQSAFTKIDIRNTSFFTIPSKKPVIMTQVPAGSYTIKDNGNGTSTLTVTDPAKFWSMSNYLVVKY